MISVVIPAYNSRDTVGDSIDSVLNQTRSDLIDEIIVVDDGSTNDTFSYVKDKYADDEKVKLIHKENGGVSTARNAGIKASKGEWIALLDSDDVWLPQKIEKQWEQIEKLPEIRFIGCNRNQENLHYGTKVTEDLYKLNLKQILIKMWPHTSTALIHRSVLKKVGLFNEKQKYAEDGELWNRISIYFPLYYIPESLEIAGGNKVSFGVKGLSANLKAMYEGNVINIKRIRKRKQINTGFYVFLRLYYWAKYIRRIVITKHNQEKKH